MFLTTILASVALFFSCSLDDDISGGGGGIPLPVNSVVYAASNTSNKIGVYQLLPEEIVAGMHDISSNNNEGIFYNKEDDELVINSKEQQVINVFSNVKNTPNGTSLSLALSSASELEHPHDIVVKGQYYIVADSELNSEEGKILIFERDENGLELRNTVSVDYEVWGLEFRGNDLFHTIPNTGDVAVFQDFISSYTTDTIATPNKRVTIERIENIRGVSSDAGVFVFTDVGDVDRSKDGAIQSIARFIEKFNAVENGGVLTFQSNQVRVSGEFTKLGNPLDVVYDASIDGIFVAENSRDGGALLFFQGVEVGGEISPVYSFPFEGASSVTFAKLR